MNRSEELAKLLNLKSKYRGSRWEFEDRTHFVSSEIFDTREEAEEYNNEEEFNVEELKIDFTKPENFVKLLEAKRICLKEIPNMMMAFLEMDRDVITSTIEASIKELNSEYWQEKGFVELFKQQAQQTEWVY